MTKPSGTRCRCGRSSLGLRRESPRSLCRALWMIDSRQEILHPQRLSKIGRLRFFHGIFHPPEHSGLPQVWCLPSCRNGCCRTPLDKNLETPPSPFLCSVSMLSSTLPVNPRTEIELELFSRKGIVYSQAAVAALLPP